MPNNSKNVKFGKPKAKGAVFFAPEGTEVPTDASTPLDAEVFSCVGYVSEEGVTETTERETEDVKAWGGDVVARPQKKYGKAFKLNLIEMNEASMAAAYGAANVTVEDGMMTVVSNSAELDTNVWVFEIALDADTVLRKVVPRGRITEVGDVQYIDDKPITYPITIGAFPDEEGNYDYAYKAEVAEGQPQQEPSQEEGE